MILFRELAEVFQKLECISSNTVLVGIVATFLSRLNPDQAKAVAYLVGEVAAPFESLEIGMAERMAALTKLGVHRAISHHLFVEVYRERYCRRCRALLSRGRRLRR